MCGLSGRNEDYLGTKNDWLLKENEIFWGYVIESQARRWKSLQRAGFDSLTLSKIPKDAVESRKKFKLGFC